MDLLYIANIEASAEVFQVLMLSFIAIALTYIYGTLLTANGSLKQLNIISLIGLVVNFGLNFWLIPEQGAYGAAVATLITQLVVILAQIVISKQILGMSYEISFILKQSALIVLVCGLSYWSQTFFSDFRLHALIISGLFGGTAFLLGLIKKEDILKLFKKS